MALSNIAQINKILLHVFLGKRHGNDKEIRNDLLGYKNISQLTGFEPVRENPFEFRVQRLNHSATIAHSGKKQNQYLNFVIFFSLALPACLSSREYERVREAQACCPPCPFDSKRNFLSIKVTNIA